MVSIFELSYAESDSTRRSLVCNVNSSFGTETASQNSNFKFKMYSNFQSPQRPFECILQLVPSGIC